MLPRAYDDSFVDDRKAAGAAADEEEVEEGSWMMQAEGMVQWEAGVWRMTQAVVGRGHSVAVWRHRLTTQILP